MRLEAAVRGRGQEDREGHVSFPNAMTSGSKPPNHSRPRPDNTSLKPSAPSVVDRRLMNLFLTLLKVQERGLGSGFLLLACLELS
jgi:hypothetical protein